MALGKEIALSGGGDAVSRARQSEAASSSLKLGWCVSRRRSGFGKCNTGSFVVTNEQSLASSAVRCSRQHGSFALVQLAS